MLVRNPRRYLTLTSVKFMYKSISMKQSMTETIWHIYGCKTDVVIQSYTCVWNAVVWRLVYYLIYRDKEPFISFKVPAIREME